MAKDNTTRGTRLPDEMDAEFEAYRDANEMNNSEALRELVRTGLSEKRKDVLADRPSGLLSGLLWDARHDFHTFVLVTLVSLLLTVVTTSPLSWVFSGVAFLYALTVAVGAIDKALNSALLRWVTDAESSYTDWVEA